MKQGLVDQGIYREQENSLKKIIKTWGLAAFEGRKEEESKFTVRQGLNTKG